MVDYREILRLSSIPNTSQRQIEATIHSSRKTIKETIETAKAVGIRWPLDESVTNEMLKELLFPEKSQPTSIQVEPDHAYLHKELARQGVTMTLLWREYTERCVLDGKTPYMYTQFCEKYRHWARKTKATMRIQHKPGEAMQVDWAGNTLDIFDSATGEVTPAYLFIATLPCSCFSYVEVCSNMRLENWLLCHVNAFNYFGGVPRLLIPDNLKTGVTKNTRYETVFNRSYQELTEHYDTAIVPARVEHPKDKGMVEGSVKHVSTWILAALRDCRFFTIDEAQQAVLVKLEEFNKRPFKSRSGCRHEAYLNEEREFMKPLPTTNYELATWTPEILVGSDYLVTDGVNKYSVPFDLIGEKVNLRLTTKTIEVFFRGNRISFHVRKEVAQRNPIVKPEHMTPEHKKFLTYNSESFTAWGLEVGPKTAAVVQYFLSLGREAEQGFKACASLIKLSERYGSKRLEKACERLLAFTQTPSIRTLTTILKNGQDKVQVTTQETIPNKQGITRGADYFRKGGNHND